MKLIFLTACVMFLFAEQGCPGSTENADLKTFNRLREEASNFTRKREFDKAEAAYLAALDISMKHKWTAQSVYTKIFLAELYFATKKYERMNAQLLEARELCIADNECGSTELGGVYDYLVLLNLLGPEDINSAQKYVNEAVSQRGRLEQDEPLAKRLQKYADYMQSSGFEKEAEELRARASSVSPS